MPENWKETYFINPVYKCRENPVKHGFWTPDRLAREPFNGAYNIMAHITSNYDAGSKTILDIGCGPASKIKKFFPDAIVCGIDLPEAICLARANNPAAVYLPCDLDNDDEIDFIASSTGIFDFILCIDVIEHVLFPEKTLGLIQKKMGPHSIAFISTLERDLSRGAGSVFAGSPHPAHVREWNQEEFTRFICDSGFQVFDSFITAQNARNASDGMMAQTLCCKISLGG